MKHIGKILTAFLVMLFSINLVAETRKLPDGTHNGTLVERKIIKDQVLVNRIVSSAERTSRVKSNAISTNDNAPDSDRAIVKDNSYQSIAFVGPLGKFSVVVPILRWESGKRFVGAAFGVEEEGNYWFPLWEGGLPMMMVLEGVPSLEVRIFDPSNAELQILSSDMDFYAPPFIGGINEVRVDEETLKVITNEWDARVMVNYAPVPEDALTRTPGIIEVGQYDPFTGDSILYTGDNLVTIVSDDGRCDTYMYRFNPSRGATTTPIP